MVDPPVTWWRIRPSPPHSPEDMVRVLPLVLFAAFCALQVSATSIPDKFLGSFLSGKDDNFNDYLRSKGVSWPIRWIIVLAKVTKKFEKAADGTYTITNSASSTVKWEGVKLGEQFEGMDLDKTKHKITFNFANGELTERHIRQYDEQELDDTYYYTINDQGELVMRMEYKGKVARLYFTKN